MSDPTRGLIAVVKDEPFESLRDAFFGFCVYLDEQKGFGDAEFAKAYGAALERRGKDHAQGSEMLKTLWSPTGGKEY